MKWYVYILTCHDGTLYTGITNNILARLEAHNCGKGAKYTRSRTPVALCALFDCTSKSEALKKESEIKKLTRQQKLKLIQEQSDANLENISTVNDTLTGIIS